MVSLVNIFLFPLYAVYMFVALTYTNYDSPWLVAGHLELLSQNGLIVPLLYALVLLIVFVASWLIG